MLIVRLFASVRKYTKRTGKKKRRKNKEEKRRKKKEEQG